MKTIKIISIVLAAVCGVAAVIAAIAFYNKNYKKSYITVCE